MKTSFSRKAGHLLSFPFTFLYPCSLNFLAVPLALNVAHRPGKAAAPASTGFGKEAQRKITLHTRHTKMVFLPRNPVRHGSGISDPTLRPRISPGDIPTPRPSK